MLSKYLYKVSSFTTCDIFIRLSIKIHVELNCIIPIRLILISTAIHRNQLRLERFHAMVRCYQSIF